MSDQGYFTHDGKSVGLAFRQGYCGSLKNHSPHVWATETDLGPLGKRATVACSGDQYLRLYSASERAGGEVPLADQLHRESLEEKSLLKRVLGFIRG